MIGSFRSKILERFWIKNDPRGIRPDLVTRVRFILDLLDAASAPKDLDVAGFGFHPLKGEMSGRFSVRVNRNWRVTFAWHDLRPEAIDIDYEDYH